jgi:hypothetical protein
VKDRSYKLECGQVEYEVICVEINELDDEKIDRYLVVPEFLLPGRRYPVYAYLYAMGLYSSNPQMSQREAAEQTRKLFGLKTFSHTTLGRAMKKLEKLIKKDEQSKSQTEPSVEVQSELMKEDGNTRVFPTVGQTRQRREVVAANLEKASQCDSFSRNIGNLTGSYRRPPYEGKFIDLCHKIVGYTFQRFHRLLL